MSLCPFKFPYHFGLFNAPLSRRAPRLRPSYIRIYEHPSIMFFTNGRLLFAHIGHTEVLPNRTFALLSRIYFSGCRDITRTRVPPATQIIFWLLCALFVFSPYEIVSLYRLFSVQRSQLLYVSHQPNKTRMLNELLAILDYIIFSVCYMLYFGYVLHRVFSKCSRKCALRSTIRQVMPPNPPATTPTFQSTASVAK